MVRIMAGVVGILKIISGSWVEIITDSKKSVKSESIFRIFLSFFFFALFIVRKFGQVENLLFRLV